MADRLSKRLWVGVVLGLAVLGGAIPVAAAGTAVAENSATLTEEAPSTDLMSPAVLGPEVLDLEAAVTVALTHNASLKTIEERQREVEGGVQEVRADAFPQLDLVSSWSRSRTPSLLNSPDFDDIIQQFPDFRPGEQELWDLGVAVSQPLYSGGKIKAARRLAETAVDINQAQIDTTRLDVALSAAEAYFGVLAAQDALKAVVSQEKARRAALEVVEARFELGEATRLEKLRAQATLAALLPRRAEVHGLVEVSKSRLRLALGLDPWADLTVQPMDPEASTTTSWASSPWSADELPHLLTLARQERPELEDLAQQAEALRHQRTISLANGRPQVELNGRYGRQVSDLDNFDSDLFADWLAAVSMRWSFYDGGRRKGERAQLDSQVEQLRWREREVVQEIAQELAAALADLETARQRLEAADIVLEVSREARLTALDSYQQGVALQADLIAAQDEEIQADLERIGALYDGLLQRSRLLRALGRLPTDDLPLPTRTVAHAGASRE